MVSWDTLTLSSSGYSVFSHSEICSGDQSKFRQSPEPFTSPRLISIGKGNEDIPAPLTMSQ
jgi:hypothetical protein